MEGFFSEIRKHLTKRKLRRVREVKWIAGICAGVAYWLGAPVWVIRLLWVILAFSTTGTGVLLYIVLLVLPEWKKIPEDFDQVTGDKEQSG